MLLHVVGERNVRGVGVSCAVVLDDVSFEIEVTSSRMIEFVLTFYMYRDSAGRVEARSARRKILAVLVTLDGVRFGEFIF